ncbi:MAG: ACP S-malonyltransferase [Planctomycetota bacterium]
MSDPFTILCPGQGAQALGMGKAWAEAHPEAKAIFDRADACLDAFAPTLGPDSSLTKPLSDLCFNGPADVLNRTDVSQPAIYATSIACWHAVCAIAGHSPEASADPDNAAPLAAAAGLSLGEYTALHVAGAFGFEDGLKLVALRGRAMQDAAEVTPSSMVALIGADAESAADLCGRVLDRLSDEDDSSRVMVPANFNAPGQVVVSGSARACDEAEQVAGEIGLRATRLTVAGAFHSPLMAPAARRLKEALDQTEVHTPRCPVLSNVTGEPHDGGDPASIRARLVEQLTSPVRWADCARWLVANDTPAPYELAPGKTLAGLMRRIDKATKVTTHDVPTS